MRYRLEMSFAWAPNMRSLSLKEVAEIQGQKRKKKTNPKKRVLKYLRGRIRIYVEFLRATTLSIWRSQDGVADANCLMACDEL